MLTRRLRSMKHGGQQEGGAKMNDRVPSVAAPAAPVDTRATASTKHASAKTSGASLPKYPTPASVARKQLPLPLAAQRAENNVIKAYALLEAERERLSADSVD